MDKTQNYIESQISYSQTYYNLLLVLIIIVSFSIRLILINLNSAEYTDGIIQINLFKNKTTFWPPFYALEISFFNLIFKDPIISGRFASLLSGSLSIIPIYLIGKLLFNRKVGYFACILYTLSAPSLRWDLKVMTDSTFTLFFLITLYLILKFFDKPSLYTLGFAIFTGGISTLTRYQGFIFVPLYILMFFNKKIWKKLNFKKILITILAVIPWILLIWWLEYRGFGHFRQFTKRAGGNIITAFQKYFVMLEAFLITIPYCLTYPIFILSYIGISNGLKGSLNQKRALTIMGYIFISWLVVHSAFRAFQERYFLQIFPLFIIFAAYGIILVAKKNIKIEKIIFAGSLIITIIFSSLVLWYQKDSFGDIKRASLYIKENLPKDAKIFSDEIEKSSFWSGRKINKIKKGKYPSSSFILLHDFYTSNLKEEEKRLVQKFKAKKVFETKSVIVPLLPDITIKPKNYKDHHPGWITYKFTTQVFRSVIYKIPDNKNKD